MGRPAISDDELAALLVVDEVSMPGVRLSAALSTASPCSSTQPLQSPLFADVPALNTAQAVAEKAEAEAEAHGQGQGRQGLSRRPPRAAMSEAAFAKRLCEDVERLARAQQRSKRFRCDPPPPPTMQGRNRPTIYPPFKIPPMGKSEAFYKQWHKERKWQYQQQKQPHQPQQPQQQQQQPQQKRQSTSASSSNKV